MDRATELYCPRDLALRLGAVGPTGVTHHKKLRDSGGNILVRDPDGRAMFWPLQAETVGSVARSS